MSAIAAHTNLQDRLGREQAQVIAEFVEQNRAEDISLVATKADLQEMRLATKADLKAESQELRELIHKLTLDTNELFSKLELKISEQFQALNTRTIWANIAQVLAIVGALLALAKLR